MMIDRCNELTWLIFLRILTCGQFSAAIARRWISLTARRRESGSLRHTNKGCVLMSRPERRDKHHGYCRNWEQIVHVDVSQKKQKQSGHLFMAIRRHLVVTKALGDIKSEPCPGWRDRKGDARNLDAGDRKTFQSLCYYYQAAVVCLCSIFLNAERQAMKQHRPF